MQIDQVFQILVGGFLLEERSFIRLDCIIYSSFL
jgi:hypothetical protein